MIKRLYLPVYAVTLTLSAFLLFAVQPLFGKMLLPLLGGSPQVWNTAMVFFQAALLAGYGYAHLTTKLLNVRQQALLHLTLMALFLIVLPIAIPEGWEAPMENGYPIFWQLGLMTMAVGGPFFVLAASAPLLQRWFSHTDHQHADDPYFLYAASNLGSMTALLSYPVLVEPFLGIAGQSTVWAAGYALLALFIIAAAFMVWHKGKEAGVTLKATNTEPPSWPLRLTWLLLAFIPSSLMLGVTTFITTDLSAVPMLWIIPLAMYVGTFIIAFSRSFKPPMKLVLNIHAAFLIIVLSLFVRDYLSLKIIVVAFHLLLFFFSALLCHMELAARRPSTAYLTEFYLIMALGGVLGGIFNALLAPLIFTIPIEYALILAAVTLVRYMGDKDQKFRVFRKRSECLGESVFATTVFLSALLAAFFWKSGSIGLMAIVLSITVLIPLRHKRVAFAAAVAATLLVHPGYSWGLLNNPVHVGRNFFGLMVVSDSFDKQARIFMHGTTLHGIQSKLEKYKLTPLSYYYPKGPAGDIFRNLDTRPSPQRVAALGLGSGTIACYAHKNRHFDFYEIDPDVVAIAQNPELFTFLSDCGSPYDIVPGDARLQIKKAPNKSYDLIFLDTFSSDNIPVHVITTDAFRIYLDKLKPGGVIAVHISNRFLDLAPVLNAQARALGMTALFTARKGGIVDDTKMRYVASIYAVLAKEPETLVPFITSQKWKTSPHIIDHAWTDDYANPFGVLWFHNPEFMDN